MEAGDKYRKSLQGSESATVSLFTKSQPHGGRPRKPPVSQDLPVTDPLRLIPVPAITHHPLAN